LITAKLDPVGVPPERTKESLQYLGDATPAISQDRLPPDEPQPESQKPASGEGFLSAQADELKARGGYLVKSAVVADENATEIEEIIAKPAADSTETGSLIDQAAHIGAGKERPEELPVDDAASREFLLAQLDGSETEPDPLPEAKEESDVRREVKLPMGAWLGFHDGETPLMARLAVYDLENDHYIFVNRQGVKMRQVSRLELLNLIDNELVDILETRSNFREEVTEVRKNLDKS
jgi:hypothetical protein